MNSLYKCQTNTREFPDGIGINNSNGSTDTEYIEIMIELTREVRFMLPTKNSADSPSINSWSGATSTQFIRPYLVLQCTVAGKLEEKTSYVCNIKLIDDLVENQIVNEINNDHNAATDAETCLAFSVGQFQKHLPSGLHLIRVALKPSPFVAYTWSHKDLSMITYTEQFEFSAAHRLHNPHLNDAENQRLFGKCNRPSGHGHNYLVDVTISKDDPEGEFDLSSFQQTVKREVIDRLDHRHLNEDVECFRELNPSVENIAKTIHGWLDQAVYPAKLEAIRVYETPKTWAEFRS